MKNLWNDADEQAYIARYAGKYHPHPDTEKEILRQAYATTLLGADNGLTMHGGGNTSIKAGVVDAAGKDGRRALYVKATGTPLNLFEPGHFVAMDLEFLEGMRSAGRLDDAEMASEFRKRQLIRTDRLPSIESLMHAFIPARIVDHSHPEALLKIANRAGGEALLAECFGGDLAVIPYARMGCDLASAVSAAGRNVERGGVAVVHHGLVAWGGGAREVYDLTIGIVNRAESFLASMARRPIVIGEEVSAEESEENYRLAAPLIREALGVDEISFVLLNTADVMEVINSPEAWIVRDPPLTPDYPMPRRILPLWLDVDIRAGIDEVSSYIKAAVDKYARNYSDYLGARGVSDPPVADLLPAAVVHPRIGVVCIGADAASAGVVADFTRQAFSIRRAVFESGGVYRCLAEEYQFDMRYRGYQRAKQ